MKINSIRFKITILYTVLLSVILIVYSGILYYTAHYTLYSDLDHELLVKAQEVSNVINSYMDMLGYNQRAFDFSLNRVIRTEGGHPDQDKVIEIEKLWDETKDRLNLKQDYINFASYKGESIVSSKNFDNQLLEYFLKDIGRAQGLIVHYKDVSFGKRNLRVISIPYNYKNQKLYSIQVGTSLKPISRILSSKLFFIIISIPFVLLPASFFGRVITIRILRPVLEVTKTARNITYKDLSVRVKTGHADEEMKYLVDAFNDMISRLDRSFKYIAEFSSDVAHELKTPLAIIRGESEVALRKERDAEDYKRVIKLNLEETERMLRTIEDLLLLTRLDYKPEVLSFEQLDVTEFLSEIKQQAQKLGAQKNINVTMDSPGKQVLMNADRLQLRRLFLNLINNAVKFTPEKGAININAGLHEDKITISVSDTGVGIAQEDLPKIFKRFFHVDRTGLAQDSGSGLGLSICLSIAKIHGGDIGVRSELGKGSSFIVTLPIK